MNKKPTENTPVGFFTVYQHFSKTEPKLKENLRNNSITDFITQEKPKEQEKIKMPSKVKPQDRGMER